MIDEIRMKVIMEPEKQIRDLQKELTEVQGAKAILRIPPCQGDLGIREKDEKNDELDRRAKVIKENIQGMIKKHQLLISESKK